MKFIKNKYGKEYKAINNFSSVLLEDLINLDNEYDKFKKITLFMFGGFSNKIIKEYMDGNINFHFKKMFSNIEFLEQDHFPLTMKLEREESNFGVIEINILDLALNIFEQECEAQTIQILHDKNMQRKLLKEIEKIIDKIGKKENITDIIIGSNSFEDEFANNAINIESQDVKYTLKELSDIWGINKANIRKAIVNGRFDKMDIEKRGGLWFITKKQMTDVFGDYGISKIRKIKKEIQKIDIDKDTKDMIRKAVDEFLENIDIEEFDYEVFKKDIVNNMIENNLNLIEEKLDIKNGYIENIKSRQSLYVYLLFFEKLFKEYNKIIKELKEEIVDIYYIIKYPDQNHIDFNKYNMRMIYMNFNNKYIRKIKLKIMGLTKMDIINNSHGLEIGELWGSFYNFSKMIKEGMMEELYNVMDSWDKEDRDICILLFGEDFNGANMDLIGEKENLLYIKHMYLEQKYNIDSIKEMIIKSIESSVDYLFDYEIGILAVHPYEKEKNNIELLNKLGFTEINKENQSIMLFNTDESIEQLNSVEKNDIQLEYNEDIDYIEVAVDYFEKDILNQVIEERIRIDSDYLKTNAKEGNMKAETSIYYEQCIKLCENILNKMKTEINSIENEDFQENYIIHLKNDELEQLIIVVDIKLQQLDIESYDHKILQGFYEKYKYSEIN